MTLTDEKEVSLKTDAESTSLDGFLFQAPKGVRTYNEFIAHIGRNEKRKFADYIIKTAGLTEKDIRQKRVLEIGGGTGALLDQLKQYFGEMYAIESSIEMCICLEYVLKRSTDLLVVDSVENVLREGWQYEKADVGILDHALEYIPGGLNLVPEIVDQFSKQGSHWFLFYMNTEQKQSANGNLAYANWINEFSEAAGCTFPKYKEIAAAFSSCGLNPRTQTPVTTIKLESVDAALDFLPMFSFSACPEYLAEQGKQGVVNDMRKFLERYADKKGSIAVDYGHTWMHCQVPVNTAGVYKTVSGSAKEVHAEWRERAAAGIKSKVVYSQGKSPDQERKEEELKVLLTLAEHLRHNKQS